MKKAFTLSEVLVSMLIISIVFLIIGLVINNYVTTYQTSKYNIKRLYSDNFLSQTFDVFSSQLKWAGSGAELFKNLYKPTFTDGKPNSYLGKGELYEDITNKIWLANSIDYEETKNKKTLYLTYLITYPAVLKRNNDGTYSPLFKEYLGEVDWAIIKSRLSPNAPGYYSRLVKLDVHKISGSGNFPGNLELNDKFSIKEVNLAVPDNPLYYKDLSEDDRYIYAIALFKNAIFNNPYITKSFRQIRFIYNKRNNEIIMQKFIPYLDSKRLTTNVVLLKNVNKFEIYLLYYENNQTKEIEIGEAKNNPSFDLNNVFALKFNIQWTSDWTFKGKKLTINKTRVITLLTNM